MKRNVTKTSIIGIVLLLLMSASVVSAAVEFSGDATMVTTYVWRGVKQYSGPAMQGTAGFSAGAVSFGLWCSSVAFGDIEVESDPYIEIALPTGSVSTSIGATIYTYDFFDTFNDDADMEYEIFGTVGYGAVGLSAYFVPSQGSTENNLNESDYWVEVSGETSLMGADLSAVFGYGTYSSKWLATPKEDAVSTLALTAGKAVSDDISVSWTYSLGLDDDMENILWMGFSYGF